MTERAFSPGFRISRTDIAALSVALIGALCAFGSHPWLSGVILFTVCHFFLFCNVLRMARPLELIWSAIFVLLAGCTLALSVPGWASTYMVSLASTLILGLVQVRSPSYHGIAWRRINPNLPQWWESRRP